MRETCISLVAAGAMVVSIAIGSMAQAAETIKVGVLHSLSGTMAISETTLKGPSFTSFDGLKPARSRRSMPLMTNLPLYFSR